MRRPLTRQRRNTRSTSRVALAALAVSVVACSNASEDPEQPATPASSTVTSAATTIPVLSVAGESSALAAALDPAWRQTPRGCLTVARAGNVIYERGGDQLVEPASTVKVASAAAELVGLGVDTRLRTTAAGSIEGDRVTGDLWLLGGGDPVLGTNAWAAAMLDADDPRTSLDALADAVVAAGVRGVDGGVIGDDSRFDAVRHVATWPARLVEDGESGPLSALSVNDGFRVWGHPGAPFDDPPAEAAGIFTQLLEERGVDVAGPARSGRAPAGAASIASVDNPPVGELVAAMLQDSDNGTAELLLKELGRRRKDAGSTDAGLAALREVLAQRGVQLEGTVLGDASGLSEAGLVRCRDLVAVLTAFEPELRDRLAVAGESGTLRRRLLGSAAAGRVRAKTGSLNGVSGLAGYADAPDGQIYAFAVIVNGLPPGATARTTLDAIAVALASTAP